MQQGSQRAGWAAIYPQMLAILPGPGWMDSPWYRGFQGRVPEQALDLRRELA